VKALGMFLLASLVALLLRSTVLAGLAARGVVIDVLVLATVTWSLRQRDAWGATFGFVLGLAADLDASHWLGRHALALTLLGYGVGRLSNTLVRDSPLTQLVLIAVATALHQVWVTAFEATGGVAGMPWMAGRVLLATVTTAPIGVLILLFTRLLSRRRGYGHATGSSAAG
jgi:rod shape-determining protein MreD